MKTARQPQLRGLYAITPDEPDFGRLRAMVGEALAGGTPLVQFRDKVSGQAERERRAASLAELCRHRGARLIVNDSVELALHCGADGVHLGESDGDPEWARSRLGPSALIGVSCYADFARAREMVGQGADYVAFGAVFPSSTKPAARRVDLGALAAERPGVSVPVAAIGGITLENAPQVIAAGVDLLAVITDLFGAPDIMARARQYQSLFSGKRHDFTQ